MTAANRGIAAAAAAAVNYFDTPACKSREKSQLAAHLFNDLARKIPENAA
jgi:hypothetical protein